MSLFKWWQALVGTTRTSRRDRPRQRPRPAVRFVPRVRQFEERLLPSTSWTVYNANDSGAGSLRDAIAHAGSGDTVCFDHALNGKTISLTSGELAITKSLTIQTQGADNVTIDGQAASRVFDICGTAGQVILCGMTIADGLADGSVPHGGVGGGVYSAAGTLTVKNCVFKLDVALGADAPDGSNGSGGNAAGGGLFNAGGSLTVQNSQFLMDLAQGGDGDQQGNGGNAAGGGLYNASGALTVSGCTFTQNLALGGNGGQVVVDATNVAKLYATQTNVTIGGGVIRESSTVGLKQTLFVAVNGGRGGDAMGGALCDTAATQLTITASTLTKNLAVGGAGGDVILNGTNVAKIFADLTNVNLGGQNVRQAANVVTKQTISFSGHGGQGGDAYGSALYVTTPLLKVDGASSISGNTASGGNGGQVTVNAKNVVGIVTSQTNANIGNYVVQIANVAARQTISFSGQAGQAGHGYGATYATAPLLRLNNTKYFNGNTAVGGNSGRVVLNVNNVALVVADQSNDSVGANVHQVTLVSATQIVRLALSRKFPF